jgi:hypothetical protein
MLEGAEEMRRPPDSAPSSMRYMFKGWWQRYRGVERENFQKSDM